MTKLMVGVIAFTLGFYAVDIYQSGVIQDGLIAVNNYVHSLLGN